MAVYKAALGARFGDAEAQRIGEVLEALEEFTPDHVADIARSNPILHNHFEWDDSAAAGQWRVHQARQMISHINIVVQLGDRTIQTKAFHSVVISTTDDDDVPNRYVTVRIAREDPDLKDQIIRKALTELESWKRRYAEYSQVFGGLFEEIERTIPQARARVEERATAAQLS